LNHQNQAEPAAVLLPEVIGKAAIESGVELSLCIPPQLVYFDGHFDAIAIVPGVVQIHWAMHYGQVYLPLAGRFARMEAIKFKELLLPGQALQLRLRYNAAQQKLEFRYAAADTEFSSGRIYLYADHV